MTPIEFLSVLLRFSVVGGVALLLTHGLLSRRPSAAPSVAMAALFCGCGFVAMMFGEWPAVWRTPLPTAAAIPMDAVAQEDVVAGFPQSRDHTAVGVGLDEIRNFFRPHSGPREAAPDRYRLSSFLLLASPAWRAGD